MLSGQQSGSENYQKFLTWMSGKTNDDFKQMLHRGQLCRKEIAVECSFCDSALRQNPNIKLALEALEDNLRKQGVLPEIIEHKNPNKLPERDIYTSKKHNNSARLLRLEQETTALRAENDHLKKMLKKYALLDEAISESGRMPR